MSTNLINCQCLPLYIAEFFGVPQSELIRRQQNIHLQFLVRWPKLMRADDFAGCSGSDVSYNVHVRSPSGKLSLPSCNRRQGNDDQKWTILVHLVEEIGQESYSLHGLRSKRLLDIKTSYLISQKYLAKSHFIC